jgi:hypothetical protein
MNDINSFMDGIARSFYVLAGLTTAYVRLAKAPKPGIAMISASSLRQE